ncbi:MAG: hypothetical protein AAGG51_10955 [Cyanobacteria bacterium P01_G01_bin.54]
MNKCIWGLSLGLVGALVFADVASANSARLIVRGGSVSIKRSGWSGFSRAGNGSHLSGSDLIRPASGANAQLQCPSGRSVPLAANSTVSVNSKCGSSRGAVRNIEHLQPLLIGARPATAEADRPYLMTPNASISLTATPWLQWNALPNATQYTVTLKNLESGEVVWSLPSSTAMMPYPAQAEPLAVETPYQLLVAAESRSGTRQSESEPIVFRPDPFLLEELEQIAQINTESPNLRVLEQLDLLLDPGLPNGGYVGEAIALLQQQIQQQPSPMLTKRLGDVYLASGFYGRAEKAYQAVAAATGPTTTLAVNTGDDCFDLNGNCVQFADVELWLGSQVALAQLSYQENATDGAIAHLETTLGVAAQICDQTWVEGIAKMLTQWNAMSPALPQSCAAVQ